MYYLIRWNFSGFLCIVEEVKNGTGVIVESNGIEKYWEIGRYNYNLIDQPGETHLYKNEDLEKVKERFMLEVL